MPKTFRNLWPRLVSFENLLEAYRAARRGKRGTRQVARFELRCEDHLLRLQDELMAGRYRPGPYHSFVVYEPKRRLISAAPSEQPESQQGFSGLGVGELVCAAPQARRCYGNAAGARAERERGPIRA